MDSRKGHDGLAAAVRNKLGLDPQSGVVVVFRSKRCDRIEVLVWDGSGRVLTSKRLDAGKIARPAVQDGVMRLSRAQFEALVEGLDWRRVHARRVRRPAAAECIRAPRSIPTCWFGDTIRGMSTAPEDIDLSALPPPDRVPAVKALAARTSELEALTGRQDAVIQELRQALCGKTSETLTEDERHLAFEDLEVAVSEVEETRAAASVAPEARHGKPHPRHSAGPSTADRRRHRTGKSRMSMRVWADAPDRRGSHRAAGYRAGAAAGDRDGRPETRLSRLHGWRSPGARQTVPD